MSNHMPRHWTFEPIFLTCSALLLLALGGGVLGVPEATLAFLAQGAGPEPHPELMVIRFLGALVVLQSLILLSLAFLPAPDIYRRISGAVYPYLFCALGPGTMLFPLPVPLATVAILAGGFMQIARRTGANPDWREPQEERPLRQWHEEIQEAAAQQERNRLARDLHDSIKQQIFTIRLASATAEARWDNDSPGARQALSQVRQSAHEAMVEMQALLLQLRPAALESTGLIEALREQGEALGYRTGAKVTVEIGDMPSDSLLPAGMSEALFRIAQEALANVARHARAGTVRIRLGQINPQTVSLEIEDDGQGFDLTQTGSGMGLRNIRERLQPFEGVLDIRTAPGQGAALRITLPLSPPSRQQLSTGKIRGTAILVAFAATIFTASPERSVTPWSLCCLGFGLWWTLRLRHLSSSVKTATLVERMYTYAIGLLCLPILTSPAQALRDRILPSIWFQSCLAVLLLGLLLYEAFSYFRLKHREPELGNPVISAAVIFLAASAVLSPALGFWLGEHFPVILSMRLGVIAFALFWWFREEVWRQPA